MLHCNCFALPLAQQQRGTQTSELCICAQTSRLTYLNITNEVQNLLYCSKSMQFGKFRYEAGAQLGSTLYWSQLILANSK